MTGGYMGRLLVVDLSNGTPTEEALDERTCAEFVGGYGLGVRVLYERMKPRVDPLGPDNILGFVTGPLAGTPALASGRYTVVAKSPFTQTWGDSNAGGDFGPYLKFAGFDAVFFTGISPRPVYFYIDNGNAELLDAADLWGRDTHETDDILRERHGARESRVACVGPAGEKMSLMAAIVNDKGRTAGRCGLGAVMGAKKLKAIVVKGRMDVPQADAKGSAALRREWLFRLNERGHIMRDYGTCFFPEGNALIGDTPIKNWTGSAPADFPRPGRISGDPVIAGQERKYGCWLCPIACGGHMKAVPGRATLSHKPEYETLVSPARTASSTTCATRRAWTPSPSPAPSPSPWSATKRDHQRRRCRNGDPLGRWRRAGTAAARSLEERASARSWLMASNAPQKGWARAPGSSPSTRRARRPPPTIPSSTRVYPSPTEWTPRPATTCRVPPSGSWATAWSTTGGPTVPGRGLRRTAPASLRDGPFRQRRGPVPLRVQLLPGAVHSRVHQDRNRLGLHA